jgi:hypothetical protein
VPPLGFASGGDGASVEVAASVELTLPVPPQPSPANTERPARVTKQRIFMTQSLAEWHEGWKFNRQLERAACDEARRFA